MYLYGLILYPLIMKKIYFLILTLLVSSVTFGQGNETFDNFTETGSSYADGTFTGNDGSTWTYVQSRGDQSITGKSLMLGRNRTSQAEVYSGTITGGIGTISFNYQRAFSTNVNLNILVNNIVVGNVTSSDGTIQNSGSITVNQPGDVVIKFISVNNSDGQVTIDDITWTGYTGTATPVISLATDITGLDYFEGNGPSNEDTFTASGSNLTTDITLNTASPDFEISLTSGSGFSNSLTLPQTGGSVSPTTIYVRLSAGLSSNSYTEDITASSTGATNEMLSVSGTVSPATPQITIGGSVNPFNYSEGSGSSDEDPFTVSGLFLTTGITVTAPANYEVSLTTGTGFASSVVAPLTTPDSVDSTTIYLRLAAGLAEGTYNGDVTASSTGAPIQTLALTGSVSPAASCPNVGDIIITEIMQNPNAVSDNVGEYFEVYNTTGAAIDMVGWEIVDLTNGSENFTVTSSVVVPAGGYAIFITSDSVTNGGITPDYIYDGTTTFLGNSSDEISLQCGGNVIDEVIWDNGATFPDPTGASMELSLTAYNATDNDNGANWGVATNNIGNGDFGTPGAANDFTLSTSTFDISTFNVYPNPTNTGFVNITTKANAAVNVTVFDVLGKQVLSKTLNNNTLDVTSLTTGVYILKLNQNGTSTTKRLIVE